MNIKAFVKWNPDIRCGFTAEEVSKIVNKGYGKVLLYPITGGRVIFIFAPGVIQNKNWIRESLIIEMVSANISNALLHPSSIIREYAEKMCK
jgi:hypothetical protein